MTRLYRLLLIAYPAPVRHAFGTDMTELFADMLREEHLRAGVLGAISVLVRTFFDLPFSAAAARREQDDDRGHGRSTSTGSGSAGSSARPPIDPRRGGNGLLDALSHNLRYAVRGFPPTRQQRC